MSIRSLRRTLGSFRASPRDPTTRLEAGSFLHATLTPDGPGTLHLRWTRDPAEVVDAGLRTAAWGPGGDWLMERVDALTGLNDDGGTPVVEDDRVTSALRLAAPMRIGASGNLYHLLLPTILAQRILAREAFAQWGRLTRQLGEPAPGPPEIVGHLRLPPAPERLGSTPTWWFHRLGIEVKRASTLVAVARHADQMWKWAAGGPALATQRLSAIPGIGVWTVGSVLGPALGDPDAVPIGDYHLPDIVAWNLAGEARADDARMLELLEPYAGQRGRVLRAIVSSGNSPPGFGPRRRTPDIRAL